MPGGGVLVDINEVEQKILDNSIRLNNLEGIIADLKIKIRLLQKALEKKPKYEYVADDSCGAER